MNKWQAVKLNESSRCSGAREPSGYAKPGIPENGNIPGCDIHVIMAASPCPRKNHARGSDINFCRGILYRGRRRGVRGLRAQILLRIPARCKSCALMMQCDTAAAVPPRQRLIRRRPTPLAEADDGRLRRARRSAHRAARNCNDGTEEEKQMRGSAHSEEKIKEVVLADRRCHPPYHSQRPSIGAPFQSFMACDPHQCLILSQPQFCPFAPQLSPSSDRREQETCGVTMTRRWNSVACFLLDLADVSLWERLCAVISVPDL